MDASQDFKSLQEAVQKALVATTRTVNGLANEDLDFQRTANPSVGGNLEEKGERLLRLANQLLKSAGKVTNQPTSTLEDTDDVEIQWKGIVDVIDTLLEKADTCLDEYTGLIKRKDAPANDSARQSKRLKSGVDQLDWSLKRANILKPQDAFDKKADNFLSGPWKPLLTSKPHATVPLEDSLVTFIEPEYNTVQYDNPQIPNSLIISQEGGGLEQDVDGDTMMTDEDATLATAVWFRANKEMKKLKKKSKKKRSANNVARYKHPYEVEIQNMKYPAQVYEKREPQKYLPVENTSAIWVDTFEGVLEMLEELKKAKEIAVDLEHHDFRTYAGLLSLMQISTREKDWIVDTLVPWRHKLEVLNEVFADPNILKVLHGAYMDIIWLQRDLGLYIVGLFDTFHASSLLGYSAKSLAFLLKKFANFEADKKYQLADWRIRPLPEEMLYYARSDTHYLLYIFDMVRNELIENSNRQKPEFDYIEQVVQNSKDVSLQRYEHPYLDPETGDGGRGWLQPLSKIATLYDSEKFSVYKAVHQWRDQLARRQDENPFFLMTNQVLADIARVLPTDKKALWSLLNNNAKVLKVYLDDLFEVIQEAKAKGINGPTMAEALRATYADTTGNGQEKQSMEIPDLETLDIKDLKSERSQLWGNVSLSSTWDSKATKVDEYAVKIIVPYPFTEETAQEDEPAEEPMEPTNRANEAEQPVVEDREFTLRSGRKRKLEEANAETEPGEEMDVDRSPDGGEDDEEEEMAKVDKEAEKKARKEERKRLKKEQKKELKKWKREQRGLEEEDKNHNAKVAKGANEEDEEQPFDYSQAEPVLHATKNGDGNNRNKGKKAFNPYGTKSGDTPKGARATNHVKGGRTATFK